MAKKNKNFLKQTRSGFRKGKKYTKSFIGLYKKYFHQNQRFANFVGSKFINPQHQLYSFNILKFMGIFIGVSLIVLFAVIAVLDVESR